jgi:hypothetical protein
VLFPNLILFPINSFHPWSSSDLSIYCHEPIQISPRRIYSKKIHQAVNNTAINVAIADLVAARNVQHADCGKRLIKSSYSYKHVIASLWLVRFNITYNTLMKRVSRALVED